MKSAMSVAICSMQCIWPQSALQSSIKTSGMRLSLVMICHQTLLHAIFLSFKRSTFHGCDRDTAAVASARAGQLYGLNALDTNIQDNKNNLTRFIILSRDPRVQVGS